MSFSAWFISSASSITPTELSVDLSAVPDQNCIDLPSIAVHSQDCIPPCQDVLDTPLANLFCGPTAVGSSSNVCFVASQGGQMSPTLVAGTFNEGMALRRDGVPMVGGVHSNGSPRFTSILPGFSETMDCLTSAQAVTSGNNSFVLILFLHCFVSQVMLGLSLCSLCI